MKSLLSLCWIILICTTAICQINYTSAPQNLQFYPRDLATNLAVVGFAGNVTEPNVDSLIISFIRSDGFAAQKITHINYNTNAAFDLQFDIEAQLLDYNFDVYFKNNTGTWKIDSVKSVVAGDAFLIQGQSNAQANRYVGNANVWQDSFIRSFGNTHPNGINDNNWYIAQGDLGFQPASIGQWGLRLARLLRDSLNIPIAIINGAHGGQPIEFFQRNDPSPYDVATNYGRTLTRLKNAGIQNNIRSIFFYQGESDGARAEIHKTLFEALYWDWTEDIKPIESFYVIQVREGCGAPSLQLRTYQKEFENYLPRLTAITVNGINGHDGCHYAFTGYSQLAHKAYYHVMRDIYNIDYGHRDIRPQRAWFSNKMNNQIIFESDDTSDILTAQNGCASDFLIINGNSSVTNISSDKNQLIISLNTSVLDSNSYLGYRGHARDNDRWILNQFGNGLFSFNNLKIDSFHQQVNHDNPSIMSGSGNALNFDGIDDLVNINTSLTQSYTKEAWIFPKNGNNHNNIISGSGAALWAPVGYGYRLSAGHNNTWNYVQDPDPLEFYTWTHVAISYDHILQVMKLYKNGVLIDSTSNVPLQVGNGLSIGGFAGGFVFNGTIDEVKIWDQVRDIDEIRTNMCQKLKGDEKDMVGYFRFDEQEGNSVPDLSNNHIATLTNFENSSLNEGAWVRSGVPLGTISSNTYIRSDDLSLSLTNGEKLELSNSQIDGFVHLYFIQEKPNVLVPPVEFIEVDSQSAFGIYFVGEKKPYDLKYYFDGNNFADNLDHGKSIDISHRYNNAQAYWSALRNKQINQHNIQISNHVRQEYILASKTLTSKSTPSNNNKIKISPNPTTGSFYLHLPSKDCVYSIVDMFGRTLYTRNNQLGIVAIDVQFLQNGTYYIVIKNVAGETFLKPLIVIK